MKVTTECTLAAVAMIYLLDIPGIVSMSWEVGVSRADSLDNTVYMLSGLADLLYTSYITSTAYTLYWENIAEIWSRYRTWNVARSVSSKFTALKPGNRS